MVLCYRCSGIVRSLGSSIGGPQAKAPRLQALPHILITTRGTSGITRAQVRSSFQVSSKYPRVLSQSSCHSSLKLAISIPALSGNQASPPSRSSIILRVKYITLGNISLFELVSLSESVLSLTIRTLQPLRSSCKSTLITFKPFSRLSSSSPLLATSSVSVSSQLFNGSIIVYPSFSFP